MLETLDAAAVRRWCGAGLAALRAHQREIDDLNVYPVPDGDTGTNLVLTMTSAQEAIGGDGDSSGLMRRMARGALLGARGNSGVIVSQILRGMADALAGKVAVRGAELARALRTATEAAYAAVARPVEGTVLSVVAAAAEGASRIKSDDLLTVARAAARSAAEALARTPQQLPALARAGVVDAGGRGLVVLLEALVEALSSNADPARPVIESDAKPADPARPVIESDGKPTDPARPVIESGAKSADPARAVIESGGEPGGPDAEPADGRAPGYEVQYLLDAEPEAVASLRVVLDGLGDSLVVVGTGDGTPPTWNVHVHVDDIGAAIEAGIRVGRPHRIAVTPLTPHPHPHAQHEPAAPPSQAKHPLARPEQREPAALLSRAKHPHAQSEKHEARATPEPHAQPGVRKPAKTPRRALGERGAVVVAAGAGLAELFRNEGTVVVGRNPSIAEMLAAVADTTAAQVVLLPDSANTHAVAIAAAREANGARFTRAGGPEVRVVPTRSPVQALAALAVRDEQRRFDDDVIAMAEAAGACRYGEVTTAAREALTVAGRCRPGDLLGLIDGEVNVIRGGSQSRRPESSGLESGGGESGGGESGGLEHEGLESGGWESGGLKHQGLESNGLEEVGRLLIDRMLGGGGELVTLVLGADAPASLEPALRSHLAQNWPFVEVQCYAGGQPRYHLLTGVE